MAAPIIFSGIQPTGRKHLGNYIGAIRQYVEGQDRGEPGDLLHRRPARDLGRLRPGRAARARSTTPTAILLAAGLDPERCVLFRQSDVREHTELTWLLSAGHRPRRPQPHAPSSRKSRRSERELASAALFYYPVLMAADVLAYRADRGPGRRRPAPARRADAGDRPPLQRALRRDPGRARAPDPRGRRPDHGPAGAGAEDVDHRRHRGRHRARPRRAGRRSARSSAAPSPTPAARSSRRARQGRDHEPDRHPRRRPRDQPRRGRARVRGRRLRRLQEGRRRGAWSSSWRRSASATPSCAPTRRRWRRRSPPGAEKARAIAAPMLADVRERMGFGPSRSRLRPRPDRPPRLVLTRWRSPISTSTSTSSPGRSTC